MPSAFLLLQDGPKPIRQMTAQLLLKQGLAEVHQFYPFTIRFKSLPGPKSSGFGVGVPQRPKPTPPSLLQGKVLKRVVHL